MKIDLTGLNAILNRMGVKPTKHKFKGATLPPMDVAIDIALDKGIETRLDKIEVQDGLFICEGRQIVIYIKDHTFKGRETVINNPYDCRKVHLYECQTIIEMKMAKRFGRYVQTARKDNKYEIDVDRRESIEVKLYPCQNCLTALNYKNFKPRFMFSVTKFLNAFDIEEFFGSYSTFFTKKPKHTDSTAPHSGYTKDWHRVSRTKRKSDGWVCNGCKVNLSKNQYQKHLHVHHINGVKSDVSDENLRCLCVVCHADEPYHGHMKHQAYKYESLIKGLRREQGLH